MVVVLPFAPRRAGHRQHPRLPAGACAQLEVGASELEAERTLDLEPVEQSAVASGRDARHESGTGADRAARALELRNARHGRQHRQTEQALDLLGVLDRLVLVLDQEHGAHADHHPHQQRQDDQHRTIRLRRRLGTRRGLEDLEAPAHLGVLEGLGDLRDGGLLQELVVELTVVLDVLRQALLLELAVRRQHQVALVSRHLPRSATSAGLPRRRCSPS